MSALRFFILTAAFLLISACSRAPEISNVQFGAFTEAGPSSVRFEAASQLSRRNSVRIGWYFSIHNPPKKITIREVIEGPTGTHWALPPNTSDTEVSGDGKTATVTSIALNPGSPYLFHHWALSESDPTGTYQSSLYVDGKLIKSVEFHVED